MKIILPNQDCVEPMILFLLCVIYFNVYHMRVIIFTLYIEYVISIVCMVYPKVVHKTFIFTEKVKEKKKMALCIIDKKKICIIIME